MIIEPVINSVVFLLIKLHIDGLKRFHLKDIVPIIQRSLLIVKGWKPYSFEMPPISFLSPHHDPHGSPLSSVDGLNHPWNLVNEADGSCDVVENFHVSDLFPWHRSVFEEFIDSVRGVFQGSKKDSFVGPVLST